MKDTKLRAVSVKHISENSIINNTKSLVQSLYVIIYTDLQNYKSPEFCIHSECRKSYVQSHMMTV